MGLFLKDHNQEGETQGAQEERTLLLGDEMGMQLDDGDRDGQGCQDDFDRHATEAERREQECDPIAGAGNGETEDKEGRQEKDETFPSPKQTDCRGRK